MLHPDDCYIALCSDNDPATPLTTVWVMDLSREAAVSRFSDLGAGEAAFIPVWSPDGRELLFSVGDERRMRLVRKSLDGGPVRPVLDSDGPKFPSDWSSGGGGRLVAFSSQWPDYREVHIWMTPLDAAGPPRAFAQHPYSEVGGCFFPTGGGNRPRWIAYTSAETGRYEVYVHDLAASGRRLTVSPNGGRLPQWRHDGRELFYVALDGTYSRQARRAPPTGGRFRPRRERRLGSGERVCAFGDYSISRNSSTASRWRGVRCCGGTWSGGMRRCD